MYIYIRNKRIINTEQVAAIGIYKKTNGHWIRYGDNGIEEEILIERYNNGKEATEVLNAIMLAIQRNRRVLDISSLGDKNNE
ncbi:MAG: hypothetical protein NC247_13650 [Ruminococcus flavefaciens]|nr:hypothetical protein [Ruminococcus flavefaciens]